MNKKSQEEIYLIGSLIIPVLIFLIALIVLYTHLAPLFVANELVFIYAYDTGALTEAAYSMPDNIIFRYKGPLVCHVGAEGEMECPRGNEVIKMRNPFLTVFDFESKPDPTLRDDICERIPFYAQNNITWYFKPEGVEEDEAHTFSDSPMMWPLSASRLDYSMMESSLTMPFRENSIEISKKRRELFDSISLDTSYVSNIQDVIGAAIYACKDREQVDLNYTNLPHYKIHNDGKSVCVQKFSFDPLQCSYDDQQDCEDAHSCAWDNTLGCKPICVGGGGDIQCERFALVGYYLPQGYDFINITCFDFAELEEITDCTFNFDSLLFNTDCSGVDLTFYTPKYPGTMKQTIHFTFNNDGDPSTNDVFINSTFYPTQKQKERAERDRTIMFGETSIFTGRC